MEKEKTVQLLEQLNCKMDKIINLLESTHIEIEPVIKGINRGLLDALSVDDHTL